ncbi:MAG: helix-turn-helix domain-containing protein [Methylophilus sp.]|uniref:helix-turn-helix domain-containing protein n=1 Tax=Methylophilus sp. TaxID=29541 RepID=UPI00403757BC
MSGYDLVEEVKKNKNIESDYKLAQALGKTRGTVSNWKQGLSKPDGETVLKLMILGDVEARRALELMQGGYAKMSLMAVTAMLSGAVILASNPVIYDLLYIMRN